MSLKVAVAPGDGIGREVIPQAVRVLKLLQPDVQCVPIEVGYARYQREGVAISDDDIEMMRQCDCVLFGAITTPPDPDYSSVVVRIRRELGLYANVRPFRAFSGITPSMYENLNLTIVRENTEGLYSGEEEEDELGAYTRRVVTRKSTQRIAKVACELACSERKRLTIVHKANVLRSDRLWRRVCIEVAERYGVPYDEVLVDACALHLVREPTRFELLLTSNLFGDILSDLAAGLVGGLGLCPSAQLGDEHAMFEPVHGSAPDIAGRNIANPIAAILCVGLMLDWAGLKEYERIEQSIRWVLDAGIRTPDIGGNASTTEFTDAVISHLER
ncbi:isocitrate/isopropylmalate dehydrogenase family protein [Methermicoccus shengliensis]|uniref:isocitrate/isopropylmalate dehydrogenase family protein n=1 Tax=Methermicoccus shengliensis TaxID=660064 RepID=UPI00076CFBE5|nr:MAG: 3-isopropylmalate dehydrogenase [Euryarchaeota archaeon 55_53]KUK30411.1 MAG: 3-isopropylmalate dehydrogenase [Methanosarcinales archeaon 56_1174]MDI3488296.1 methanogen homoisocitrate dehydrogenase [Methanosarcinales archaeon]MDN5295335.1 methanogen homoisocitrate dehydrogenase [Methanosarcinales archaeon]